MNNEIDFNRINKSLEVLASGLIQKIRQLVCLVFRSKLVGCGKGVVGLLAIPGFAGGLI